MRIVGWLAAILGVVGLILCLVIAVGVWFVRPEVVSRVDRLATVAVEGLDHASALSADAEELVIQVRGRLDTLATTARSVATNPVVDAVVDRALNAAITNVVSGPWNRLQDRLGGMRERVVGIANVVQTLDDAIPFIELPGVVTGFVGDVDARWTEIDQTVQGLEDIAAEGAATTERAGRIADAATSASERLDAVSEALARVHGKVEEAQADIVQAADEVESILTWTAVIVSVVAIWVGLLHLLLVVQGRRWIRDED
jgi:hypothetical protein